LLTNSIDIDALFDDETKGEPSTPSKNGVKAEPPSGSKRNQTPESDNDILPPPQHTRSTPSKPKHGRLISNGHPLEDFERITSSGDVFRKAIQDMGAVVKENVEGSFSRSAFPLAIDCLKAMRETALEFEEVETYNE
jgi:ATP-dependent DNA helicase 2 subunit 2